MKETMELSRDAFGGGIVGLAVVIVEDGKYVERIAIFEELMVRRRELEKKNQSARRPARPLIRRPVWQVACRSRMYQGEEK